MVKGVEVVWPGVVVGTVTCVELDGEHCHSVQEVVPRLEEYDEVVDGTW